MAKRISTNNDLQNTTQKSTQTPLKTGCELRCPEEWEFLLHIWRKNMGKVPRLFLNLGEQSMSPHPHFFWQKIWISVIFSMEPKQIPLNQEIEEYKCVLRNEMISGHIMKLVPSTFRSTWKGCPLTFSGPLIRLWI